MTTSLSISFVVGSLVRLGSGSIDNPISLSLSPMGCSAKVSKGESYGVGRPISIELCPLNEITAVLFLLLLLIQLVMKLCCRRQSSDDSRRRRGGEEEKVVHLFLLQVPSWSFFFSFHSARYIFRWQSISVCAFTIYRTNVVPSSLTKARVKEDDGRSFFSPTSFYRTIALRLPAAVIRTAVLMADK